MTERSDPSPKQSITFSVGLPQPAYASVRDMSVQTVHRVGKQSALHLPAFHSLPDDMDLTKCQADFFEKFLFCAVVVVIVVVFLFSH